MIDTRLAALLERMVRERASDLFLSPGAPPNLKVDGVTRHLGETPLAPEDVSAMALSAMDQRQREEFNATLEMNLGLRLNDQGRYRVNIYRQRGEVAMAVRFLSADIPTLDQLHLPAVLKDLVMLPRGLVLVVGAAGSGKSTTLASMIAYRAACTTGHILTIEDPIEYLHRHDKSMVDQREVGLDTRSFADALRNAMREAPDVILIGEIRDRETMQQAISYAQSGHLCLSTLHANNANQALERVQNFFPEEARPQALFDLSLDLRAVISLRLIQGLHQRRVPAVELLLQSPYVSDLIAKGQVGLLKEAMVHAVDQGMQSFDQSLLRLYREGRISREQAIANADSRTDLALNLRLSARPDDNNGLALEPREEPEAPVVEQRLQR